MNTVQYSYSSHSQGCGNRRKPILVRGLKVNWMPRTPQVMLAASNLLQPCPASLWCFLASGLPSSPQSLLGIGSSCKTPDTAWAIVFPRLPHCHFVVLPSFWTRAVTIYRYIAILTIIILWYIAIYRLILEGINVIACLKSTTCLFAISNDV